MNTWRIGTKVFLVLVGLAFLNVALQAFANPQAIMDLVNVQLGNISARNSIRSYYGGVNLAFALFLVWGAFKMPKEALLLTFLYCVGFVLGRVYSLLLEGIPGRFVMTWLAVESVVAVASAVLLYKTQPVEKAKPAVA